MKGCPEHKTEKKKDAILIFEIKPLSIIRNLPTECIHLASYWDHTENIVKY